MSQYLVWIILSSITGSPVGSGIALLVFYLFADRFTLGLLPDPLRWWARRRRAWQLERTLLNNPHDGRARLELAELYVGRGAHTKAIEVLKPNLERGEDDVQTLFVMGAACLGARYFEQGEKLLAHAQDLEPGFRVGELDLVLGRGRLARGDFRGAREALERLVAQRKGSVEGRVLLSRALLGLGDDGAAALVRDQAWTEYVAAPGFQRRRERWWAWRARPSRPALYLTLALAGLFAFGTLVAPRLKVALQQSRYAQPNDPDDDGQ